MIDWGVAMMARMPVTVALACNRALTQTDFRDDLRAIRIPSLVVHGTADASAPYELTGKRTAALIPDCELRIYEGAPHGLMFTHRDRLHADLLGFLRGPIGRAHV